MRHFIAIYYDGNEHKKMLVTASTALAAANALQSSNPNNDPIAMCEVDGPLESILEKVTIISYDDLTWNREPA